MGIRQTKATEQAFRHAKKFFDENEWPDILEKFAEVNNKFSEETSRLTEWIERGARIENADIADLDYYEMYTNLFAHWIAFAELRNNGYETDKRNRWILKNQDPSKKKFGFRR